MFALATATISSPSDDLGLGDRLLDCLGHEGERASSRGKPPGMPRVTTNTGTPIG
jgi:hypothetical protein